LRLASNDGPIFVGGAPARAELDLLRGIAAPCTVFILPDA
jgi:hypothetical protein